MRYTARWLGCSLVTLVVASCSNHATTDPTQSFGNGGAPNSGGNSNAVNPSPPGSATGGLARTSDPANPAKGGASSTPLTTTDATSTNAAGGISAGGTTTRVGTTAVGGTSATSDTPNLAKGGSLASSVGTAGGTLSATSSLAQGGNLGSVVTATGGNSGFATGGQTTRSSTSSGGTASGGQRSSGGAMTGGNASTGTSSAGTSGTDPFALAWEDNFDKFDSARWQLMTHSWDGNLAQFSTENTSISAGILAIHLTTAAGDSAKPYRGVEMRSKQTFTYGRVSSRIRFAKGPGVVSGLVTIYTPWPADDWNEIDIEHLGKSPSSSQLNCMVYTGAPTTPPVTQSVTPTQDPLVVDFGFNTEASFHQYDIEWTPSGVKFFVDSKLVRTWNKDAARMKLPQNILFTIWASNASDWAGSLVGNSAPTSAEIDWIRVYDWKG